MELTGKKLELISITRQNLLDADFICSCDNCGRPIVNIATVKDEKNKIYNIGLDCKKTLIDTPKINEILALNDWDSKYKIKEFKQGLNEVSKFLKICAYPDVEILINNFNEIIIKDKLENKYFPGLGYFGNDLYRQNLGYLLSLGVTHEFISDLTRTRKFQKTY